MPVQPPRFGVGAAPRKPWAPTPGVRDRRKRGRAGVADRATVMREEPFCRTCLAKGLRVASDVVDHIKPLSEGGADVRANKQGLCNPCHDVKTKAERAAGRAARP